MRAAHLALAVLVVVGSVAPVAGAATGTDRQAQTRADPATDEIGWEGGYWHDESIDVDQSDGLSDAELDAYVSRAMARVEFVRGAEFEESVPVEVIAREEFRQRANNGSADAAFAAWNNQVWEAMFVDGEDSNVQDELGQTIGASTSGFYSPTNDEIRIVTETPDSPTIDNATLVHELTHALQDQTVDLTSEQLRGETQDADLAVDGLVEGEANLVEALYSQRCGTEWECVGSPPRRGGGEPSERPNLGILLTILQPYSDGPVYVNDLRRRGGWDAVRAAYDDPPASTEQVIHLTDEEPVPIEFEDRARGAWTTYPDQGVDGSDTLGEASIYAMFWYQARASNANTVDPRNLGRTSAEFDTYNYGATPSAGWGNDRVFPYRDGPPGANDTRHGYVWVTEWDTERDAREFREAYLAVLAAQGAVREDGVRVIADGPFADAFRVVRDGTRVTVVNGPTPAAVDAIRPGLAGERAESGSGEGESDDGRPDFSGRSGPGFGPVVAVIGVLVAALAALRRRR